MSIVGLEGSSASIQSQFVELKHEVRQETFAQVEAQIGQSRRIQVAAEQKAWHAQEVAARVAAEAVQSDRFLQKAGLALSRQKCTCAQIRRQDQKAEAIPSSCEASHSMPELSGDECMRVLGALVQPQGDAAAEFRLALAQAWRALK